MRRACVYAPSNDTIQRPGPTFTLPNGTNTDKGDDLGAPGPDLRQHGYAAIGARSGCRGDVRHLGALEAGPRRGTSPTTKHRAISPGRLSIIAL
jgi:hypothetical protein